MKEPIARHKERLRDITMCLENELDFIETQLAFLRSVAQKNITAQQDLWEYERQYKTAVRRGLDEFDRATYLTTRAPT